MNNYSAVFHTIKKHCQHSNLLDRDCYERVISEIQRKRSLNSPNQYLEILRDLGLIRYCADSHIIGLTEKGKRTETLFEGKDV